MKKNFSVIFVFCILLLIAGFSTGCISKIPTPTPATTNVTPATDITTTVTVSVEGLTWTATPTIATESRNKAATTLPLNNVMYVTLDENIGTGYYWNMTVTPGLTIVSDKYVAPISTNGMGASGTHVWEIKATAQGPQKISAILKRPTDATRGVESSYTLFLTVS